MIAGLSAAIKDFGDRQKNSENARTVKEYLIEKLSLLPDTVINSPTNSID